MSIKQILIINGLCSSNPMNRHSEMIRYYYKLLVLVMRLDFDLDFDYETHSKFSYSIELEGQIPYHILHVEF